MRVTYFFGLIMGCLVVQFTACVKKTQKLAFNGMGYYQPNLFVFDVETKNAANKPIRHDTLGLFCSDIRFITPDSQYMMLWNTLSSDKVGKYHVVNSELINSLTGLGYDDTFLFIHPPRHGFYRILQFCPYPNFFGRSELGSNWDWTLNIGQQWAIDTLFPVVFEDTFETKYKLDSIITRRTVFGDLECYKIIATETSKYGISTGCFYLNNQYGLVNFEFRALDKYVIKFSLIAVLQGMEGIGINKDFIWYVKRGKESRNKMDSGSLFDNYGIGK